MKFENEAKLILNLLSQNGYKSYIVGGAVRDYLMNRSGGDIDITTSAKPTETEKVLSDENIPYYETGIKHGTITAVLNKKSYEITTFRSDGEYDDNRHPDNVDFLDTVDGDLKRRDFTMNAIAYNDEDGLVDLFGGQNDINNHIIRAVGDAEVRFDEDALRIMRAVRFASQLSFDIESETKAALFEKKELLKNVSPERIFIELSKLLMGDNVYNVLMEYRDIIGVIVPEIKATFDLPQNNPYHIYDVYSHIAHSVESAPKDLCLRLTMLFHDLGKPSCKTTDEKNKDHFYSHPKVSYEMTCKILKGFHVSNEIFNRVTTLVLIHDGFIRNNEKSVKKNLKKYGKDISLDLIEVKRADMSAQNPDMVRDELNELDLTKELLLDIVNRGDPVSVGDLAIDGHMLISMGYKGKQIGETLEKILDLVIDGKLNNKKEDIIDYINNNNID